MTVLPAGTLRPAPGCSPAPFAPCRRPTPPDDPALDIVGTAFVQAAERAQVVTTCFSWPKIHGKWLWLSQQVRRERLVAVRYSLDTRLFPFPGRSYNGKQKVRPRAQQGGATGSGPCWRREVDAGGIVMALGTTLQLFLGD
jgi:hypothetical protein